ncbi:MAG TPA: hypothetical protein VM619_01900 [Luteimonas sp.]|nr:hypothetical protein [Luteimonas sp.]
MAIGNSTSGKQTTLRHVWLASLGALVVARREVRYAVGEMDKVRERAAQLAGDAALVARGGALALRERAEPVVGRVGAQLEQGLAPMLERLGLQSPPRRKSPPRRQPRKPVAKKKTTPRPLSARRQADRRIARKGR